MRQRDGVTLVELMVVLMILALTTSLTGLALRRLDAPREADASEALLALRREAIASGHPITRVVRHDHVARTVTVLADGRVFADSVFHVAATTGVRDDATR